MSGASKMIFYDIKQRRKIYFRVLILLVIGVFVGGFAYIFYGIVNHDSERDYYSETTDFYDYYYENPNNAKKLALTFDDGPNPEYTYDIMETLEKHNVPAVFFLMGSKVLKHEEVVRVMDEKGFEIGNHSFTHSYDVHKSIKGLEIELSATEKLIRNITGESTIFYRPPFLLDIGIDPTINPYIPEDKPLVWAASEGYIPVGADVDSKDWAVKSVDEVFNNVIRDSEKGHIILLHDGEGQAAEKTVASLDRLITELKAKGYEFVTLSELFGLNRNVRLTYDMQPASADADTGGKVSELQLFLKKADFDYLKVTGQYDIPTAFAVDEWERKNGVQLEHSFRAATSDKETKNQVSRLQNYLKEHQTPWLEVTGYYDYATVQAVKIWQKRNGVPETEFGSVGPETRKLIYEQSRHEPKALAVTEGNLWQQATANLRQNIELWYVSLLSLMGPALFFALKIVLLLVIFRSVFLIILYFYSLIFQRKKPLREGAAEPWVSVLIPAYNEGENIASTILSIARSPYQKKEIIVINDGSKDNTADVVRRVIKEYPEMVRLINIPNGGKANALNVGIEHAQHDIVISLDGDSIFGENTIAALARHFKDRSVGAVAGKVSVVDSGRLLGTFQNMEYITGQNMEKRAFASINAINVVPGPVGAWRKDLVYKLGGFREDTLVEDQDLSLAIQTSGKRIVYEPEAVAYTETPVSVRDFMKQRFRWVFGTLQCFWKYKGYLFSLKRRPLGWVILPNVILSNTIIPLFFPIVDILSIVALVLGNSREVAISYLAFMVFDILYASFAFWEEKGRRRLLFLLPLQRLFYRQIMYVIIIKSIIKAIEGTGALWNKVRRAGLTQKFYFENAVATETNPAS